MEIIIQPSSDKLDNDILNLVVESISKEFVNSKVTVTPLLKFDIHDFISKHRNQLRSSDFLFWILEKLKPTKEMKILLIGDIDAYSGDLNFVFGEAHLGGRVAAIYLPRLRPEFYNLKPNELLFYDRITKEAVHELGHSFGLFHCNNKRCVMYFSNSLYDTDFKNKIFCKNCKINYYLNKEDI
jgi:archaemetzincin